MKKIIFLCISIIIGILVYYKNEEIIIPSNAIRIRIIANSNSASDINIKNKLKKEIEESLYSYINDSLSDVEVENIINENINNLKNIISKKMNNFDIKYGMNYFPKKVYRGVIYPEGNYKSLVITLGKGLGDNWWCVLYPPLCLIKDIDIAEDVTYRSFVYDLLNN